MLVVDFGRADQKPWRSVPVDADHRHGDLAEQAADVMEEFRGRLHTQPCCQPRIGLRSRDDQVSKRVGLILQVEPLTDVIVLQVVVQRRGQFRRSIHPDALVGAENVRQREHPAPGVGEEAFGARGGCEWGDGGRREIVDEPDGIGPAGHQHGPAAQVPPGQRPLQFVITDRWQRDGGRTWRLCAFCGLVRLVHGGFSTKGRGIVGVWQQISRKFSTAARTFCRDAAYEESPQHHRRTLRSNVRFRGPYAAARP